ncbi:cell division protein kinase, putative [Phytophthora infestans T30-4]|uniref:Cyclin-dependent kinase 2 homolog n=1 Tax=Phytophthora infestans (strain T30-4) TaxID=403677 RepID=D0P3Z8_PHYIT|nr:cell division protein kinase, putative [Phytophthora infestans T30-4]EEY62343.1 cell division protein kinase, putative [Phytophthora infestans T30-4]|eukprot:XP_002894977.1 cell division protein kinase, putative [Phytophthora infestans T30-4]
MTLVSKNWRELTDEQELYRPFPSVTPDGSVNWINFKKLSFKCEGSEGECFKCLERSTGRVLAMKRTRIFPEARVPYYMIRELSLLKGTTHDHITSLEIVSLVKDELHMFFPYVDRTLDDVIYPTGSCEDGRVLPEPVIRKLLYQLLDAVAYCHRRGVLHRNLKLRHLLIQMSEEGNLSDATLQISDFALARATGIPGQAYTDEVVTRWYRAPELLMGVVEYSSAVGMWSVGCIFAEMIRGEALFTGVSEIDQLFQIFSKLSTPTLETWPGFSSLPNYQFEFPHFERRPTATLFPDASDLGIDLLAKLLTYNPDERILAEEALGNPYFFDVTPVLFPVKVKDCMSQMWRAVTRMWSPTPQHLALFHSYLRQTETEIWAQVEYLDGGCVQIVPPNFFSCCHRYLEFATVEKSQLQLLGAACLHAASKMEDLTYIGVRDLVLCAENVYTATEVLEMEVKVLNTLNFALLVPTALDFLNIYGRLIPPIEKKTSMLAHYLLELSLQEYQFLKYSPSVVATCCLSMAMYMIDGGPMSKDLANVCLYSWSDLQGCMMELQKLSSNASSNTLTTIKKRYSRTNRCEVAKVSPPESFDMAF